MRKPTLLLVAVALLAAACSTDTFELVATQQAPAVATPDADAEPASADEAPTEEAVAATCGFGDDLEPVGVAVSQIPGDGRGDNISALDSTNDPSFGAPLVDLNLIISGGPPPDGIPPIDSPVFQTANSVDWLQCNEPVLVLSVDGEARAYPIQIMTWHELVNDTFGDVPVAVSYCPLCNSALAYRRDLGERTVTFGTSGRVFNSSLVMYDRETESLWTHYNGSAVAGELVGTELELLPLQTLAWSTFLQSNPDGLVLTRDTGFDRRYGQNPYTGYDDVTTDPFLFVGESDPRLAAKERIVAIRRNDDNVAVVLSSLESAGVLEVEVAGEALSVWHQPGTATALETQNIAAGRDIGATGVFETAVDGQQLTFARADEVKADGGNFVDDQTGSTWTIQGLAVGGPLAGSQLQQVEHLDTFWFALAAFEPDTRIVNP